jgi:hypothetical protein
MDERLSAVIDLIHHVNNRIDVALNLETHRSEERAEPTG